LAKHQAFELASATFTLVFENGHNLNSLANSIDYNDWAVKIKPAQSKAAILVLSVKQPVSSRPGLEITGFMAVAECQFNGIAESNG
jgi:hypothetical protein